MFTDSKAKLITADCSTLVLNSLQCATVVLAVNCLFHFFPEDLRLTVVFGLSFLCPNPWLTPLGGLLTGVSSVFHLKARPPRAPIVPLVILLLSSENSLED